MLKVIVTTGIPASGKSTWAKEEVSKDPDNWVRVNRDSLRTMLNNYTHSKSNEEVVKKVRDAIIKESLLSGRNVIVDECNVKSNTFKAVCNIVDQCNIDCFVQERAFPIDVEEAVSRNSMRSGTDKLDEKVVRQFYKLLGSLSKYSAKNKMFHSTTVLPRSAAITGVDPKVVIVDLDSTLSLFNCSNTKGNEYIDAHNRNPYNPETCNNDSVNESLKMILESLYNQHVDLKIMFMSGR